MSKDPAIFGYSDGEKCCGNCDWWTGEHGAVNWEEGFAVCGKRHAITLYGKEVHVSIVMHEKMPACEKWEPEENVPVMTDEKLQELLLTGPEEAEDDNIGDESWKVIQKGDGKVD